MKKVIDFILHGSFKKKNYEHVHFVAVSKKDDSGRYRYFLYINGKLAKNEISFEGWAKREL